MQNQEKKLEDKIEKYRNISIYIAFIGIILILIAAAIHSIDKNIALIFHASACICMLLTLIPGHIKYKFEKKVRKHTKTNPRTRTPITHSNYHQNMRTKIHFPH